MQSGQRPKRSGSNACRWRDNRRCPKCNPTTTIAPNAGRTAERVRISRNASINFMSLSTRRRTGRSPANNLSTETWRLWAVGSAAHKRSLSHLRASATHRGFAAHEDSRRVRGASPPRGLHRIRGAYVQGLPALIRLDSSPDSGLDSQVLIPVLTPGPDLVYYNSNKNKNKTRLYLNRHFSCTENGST